MPEGEPIAPHASHSIDPWLRPSALRWLAPKFLAISWAV